MLTLLLSPEPSVQTDASSHSPVCSPLSSCPKLGGSEVETSVKLSQTNEDAHWSVLCAWLCRCQMRLHCYSALGVKTAFEASVASNCIKKEGSQKINKREPQQLGSASITGRADATLHRIITSSLQPNRSLILIVVVTEELQSTFSVRSLSVCRTPLCKSLSPWLTEDKAHPDWCSWITTPTPWLIGIFCCRQAAWIDSQHANMIVY